MTQVVPASTMTVEVIEECGYGPALYGMGLSHGLTAGVSFNEFCDDDNLFNKAASVAWKLADKDGGHNKLLESIQVWLDIRAPRYWWQEMDTYRVGTTKQSESTIHTITRRKLKQEDFNRPINQSVLGYLNELIEYWQTSTELKHYWFAKIKDALPEGFMQRRVVNTNYKTLRNILQQRRNHRLPEWHTFISAVVSQVLEPTLIMPTKGIKTNHA